MKLRLSLIGLLCFCSTYAQGPTGGSQDDFAPPTVTPVAPESGSIQQYGNIPVNMSAGQMSFQAPIFDINIRGGYSWPVHLNYRYGGLVLEGKPSMAGLGWLLSGGGVVNREVRGLPDNNPYGINGVQNGDLVTPVVNGTGLTYAEANGVVSGQADSERDAYNVSVGGVSFAFKIDASNNPVYLSKHNHKVSFPSPTPTWINNVRPGMTGPNYYGDEIREFTVTDDRGIVYLFDLVEISEPKGLEPVYSESGVFGYFSSWNLTKVTFPNNQQITFSYDYNTFHNWDYSAGGYKNVGAPFVTQPGSCSQLQTSTGYSDSAQYTVMERSLLNGITFPTGSIEFSMANNTARNVYTQILVKDGNGQVIYDYDLTHSGNRDALMEVTKDGEFYYEFEYFNLPNMPQFVDTANNRPFAQDYWGFYNARGNSYMLNIPQTSTTADKRPNAFGAMIGAMTRVKYPTGGYTDIKYQQNEVKKLYSEVEDENYAPNRQILLKVETDNVAGTLTEKTSTLTYTFDHEVIALVSHKAELFDLSSDIRLQIAPSGCTQVQPHPGPYFDAATNLRTPTNPIPDFCVELILDVQGDQCQGGGCYPLIFEQSSSGYIKIRPGTYTFTITGRKNNLPAARSKGEILVQFYDPPESTSGDPYVNAVSGGIRVREVTHIDAHGGFTKQNFDYNDDQGLSTGVELARGQTSYTVDVLYDCNTIGDQLIDTNYRYDFDRINYLSKAYNPLNLNSGMPVFYERVKQFPKMELVEISSGGPGITVYPYPLDQNPDGTLIFTVLGDTGNGSGDDMEERFTYGYTLNGFVKPDLDYTLVGYPNPPSRTDLAIGRVDSTVTYAYNIDADIYDLRKDVQLSYGNRLVDPVVENHPYNVKMANKRVYTDAINGTNIHYDLTGAPPILPPQVNGSNNDQYFHMPVYRETNRDFVPTTTVDKTYSQVGEQVSATTQNTYDSYFQLKQTEVTDSKGDVIKQIFYYPYDIVEAQYTAMVNANQIGKVVQREVKHNNVLHQRVKTNFASASGDYKPNRSEGAKGSGSLEERMFYEYDTYGNITQYYTAKHDASGGGPSPLIPIDPVSFIWGYDRQFPVAKIQGIALSDIPVGYIATLQNTTNQASLIAAQQALRNDLALAGALVTTYTYDPYIGITSQRDPKGYTIFYEYDARDRIERIRDQDNYILKEFNYNLVTD